MSDEICCVYNNCVTYFLIDTLKPKEAKEAVKKLLEAGKLTIHKKAPTKRSGFKRVGEVPGQVQLSN